MKTEVRLGADRIHSGQDPRLQPRIASNPALALLLNSLQDELTKQDGSFWNCELPFRQFLTDPDALANFLNFELEQIQRSPFYGPNSASGSYFPIHESEYFSLFLLRYKKQTEAPDALAGTPSNCFMGVLSNTPLTLNVFEQPDLRDSDVLDRSKRLKSLGSKTLRQGEIFDMHAGRHVVDVLSDSETLVLMLSSRAADDIVWDYDRRTLAPLQAVSNSLASSRLEFAINYSGVVGNCASLDAVTPFVEHELHYIRWSAVRSVMRLDPQRGVALLKNAANDRHPHVRNAAQRTLQRLAAANLVSV